MTQALQLAMPWGFIRRKGLALYEDRGEEVDGVVGEEPFCFLSFNVPELTFIQEPWRLPTSWEIRDALTTIVQQGGRVARAYTLSVRDPQAGSGDRPSHLEWDAAEQKVVLNEGRFRVLDQVLATARELGVRIIQPLIDQWDWVGGIKSFARFRGHTDDLEHRFWTDDRIRHDFVDMIVMLTNRINTVTGVRYGDDPTILAWETGNELESPFSWTQFIAGAIKMMARQLVIDGRQGVDPQSLKCSHVDIVSKHYYPSDDGKRFRECLQEDLKVCDGQRPFFIGEFGFAMLSSTEVVYASAKDGRLVEESLQGGSQSTWKVTEHSQREEHRAPRVAASDPLLFECVFGSARVLYRGAEDGRVYELWYCGEAWRVARRNDEDGRCVGGGGGGDGRFEIAGRGID